jgi:hypothetical protein
LLIQATDLLPNIEHLYFANALAGHTMSRRFDVDAVIMHLLTWCHVTMWLVHSSSHFDEKLLKNGASI